MENVLVDKERVLKRIKKNKEDHVKDYTELMEQYKVSVKKQATEIKDLVSKDDYTKLAIVATRPSSYEKDYDRAIEMLEMSVVDELMLSEKDFNKYVMNEWQWSDLFNSTKTAYGML